MKPLANSSLKDDIYTYLHGQVSLNALVALIGWGQMPDTAVSKKQVIYSMISDVRFPESSFRNQRWRFWISVPAATSGAKESTLTIANKLLDLLHEVRGSFGSTYIHFSENVSNQDPFFDENSNSWMVIQDYMLKMRTLQ